MSLSKAKVREILSAANVDADHMDEAVKAIIDGNVTSIEALREEIASLKESVAKYKEEAGKLPGVQKELDTLKEQIATDAKNREGKDYDKLKEEFDNYKTEVENKAVRTAKEAAYKEILKDAGIPEKHYAKILKYSDVDGVELDDNGKIKGAGEILKSIKDEWSDHIEQSGTKGADVQTPPESNGNGKTKAEIMAIKDTKERQAAIAENPELFGLN